MVGMTLHHRHRRQNSHVITEAPVLVKLPLRKEFRPTGRRRPVGFRSHTSVSHPVPRCPPRRCPPFYPAAAPPSSPVAWGGGSRVRPLSRGFTASPPGVRTSTRV